MIELLFGQYANYDQIDIILEVIGVLFGLLSVLLATRNNLLVYPSGMISTAIFVYLLYKFDLIGDMVINAYYFVVSIYGWYVWTLKVNPTQVTPITKATKKEHLISAGIFLSSVTFVIIVYNIFDKWNSWTAYVDTVTTAIFFVGMWLMAKRKVENWIYWIIGDLISIPLYFYKGLTLTAIQYLIFTIIAFFGYRAWIRYQNKPVLTE